MTPRTHDARLPPTAPPPVAAGPAPAAAAAAAGALRLVQGGRGGTPAAPLPPAGVLALQRAAGNRAVQRLLAPASRVQREPGPGGTPSGEPAEPDALAAELEELRAEVESDSREGAGGAPPELAVLVAGLEELRAGGDEARRRVLAQVGAELARAPDGGAPGPEAESGPPGVIQRTLFGELLAAVGSTTGLVVGGGVVLFAGAVLALREYRRRQRVERLRLRTALVDDLNSAPGRAPGREEIFARVRSLAGAGRLEDLPALRGSLDVLTQFASDAVMKNPDPSFVTSVKAPLLEAAVHVQQAYLLAAVRGDFTAAQAQLAAGCRLLLAIPGGEADRLLNGPLGEGRPAAPKQREAGYRLDMGAMTLANATAREGFHPQLVVGLPTGGAHAASRYGAASAILTGETPDFWLTRPQGVKEESQELMKGVRPDDYFKKEELDHLAGLLRERGMRPRDTVSVFVVDDGQSSGKTLEMTRRIYREALEGRGFTVDVRTGVVVGGSRDERSTLQSEYAEPTPNFTDYVVNNSEDRGGRRTTLGGMQERGEGTGRGVSGTVGGPVNYEVTVASGTESDRVRVFNLLDPPTVMEVHPKSD